MDSTITTILDGNKTVLNRALIAIENNDIEYIKQLLKSPGRLEVEKAGELIVSALELDMVEIAKELIDYNVSLQATNDDDSTCLMIAA